MIIATRIARPPTAFSTSPAGKGKRRPREMNEGHLKWIRSLPCVITGRMPVEACHVRFSDVRFGKPETPMAQKPADKWCLPMCPEKHREQHAMNERDFWARHGLDPVAIAAALYASTGDDEAAFAIVQTARATAETMRLKP